MAYKYPHVLSHSVIRFVCSSHSVYVVYMNRDLCGVITSGLMPMGIEPSVRMMAYLYRESLACFPLFALFYSTGLDSVDQGVDLLE